MNYLKKAITKKEAKQEVAEFYSVLRDGANKAKNVQTKDYLNIIADNLIQLEKLADQRTK